MHKGHKNRNHWSVSFWIFNDRAVYNSMKYCIENTRTLDAAARYLLYNLFYFNYPGAVVKDFAKPNGEIDRTPHTPDAAPFTFTSVRAALVGVRHKLEQSTERKDK